MSLNRILSGPPDRMAMQQLMHRYVQSVEYDLYMLDKVGREPSALEDHQKDIAVEAHKILSDAQVTKLRLLMKERSPKLREQLARLRATRAEIAALPRDADDNEEDLDAA